MHTDLRGKYSSSEMNARVGVYHPAEKDDVVHKLLMKDTLTRVQINLNFVKDVIKDWNVLKTELHDKPIPKDRIQHLVSKQYKFSSMKSMFCFIEVVEMNALRNYSGT